jgi:hypothetical protein
VNKKKIDQINSIQKLEEKIRKEKENLKLIENEVDKYKA